MLMVVGLQTEASKSMLEMQVIYTHIHRSGILKFLDKAFTQVLIGQFCLAKVRGNIISFKEFVHAKYSCIRVSFAR